MADDGANQHPRDRSAVAKPPGLLTRAARLFAKVHRALAYIIGLPTITVLGGMVVGYYQYLNAYQEKISARAGEDMKAATETFAEVSKKFSAAHELQSMLLSDLLSTMDNNAGTGERTLATKHAQSISPAYESAGDALLQSGEVMARSAEIYIDWATDLNRDPAAPHFPNADPLSRSLLAAYDFDCSDNLPAFVPTEITGPKNDNNCRVDPNQPFDPYRESYVSVCPKRSDKAESGNSVTIHWYSAKHQVLTMHYCFQGLHERLAKVRSWASQADSGPPTAAAFAAEREQIRKGINNQAARLNAFMGLALFQIDAIRIRYQPVSFVCHLPFVTLFKESCTPINTQPYLGAKKSDTST